MKFNLAHIGINTSNQIESREIAELLHALFGFSIHEGSSSIFLNDEIEVMKAKNFGKNGHVAIASNDLDLALLELEKSGVAFRFDTRKLDEQGRVKSIYLKEEIGGFAFHLLRK